MADFDYLVIDTKGREVRGHIAAPSIDDARVALDRRRLYVVKVEPGSGRPAKGKPLLSDLRIGRAKMNTKQLTLFTRQLATLNRVSPLEESLRTISRQTEQEHVRAIVDSVHSGVVEGGGCTRRWRARARASRLCTVQWFRPARRRARSR